MSNQMVLVGEVRTESLLNNNNNEQSSRSRFYTITIKIFCFRFESSWISCRFAQRKREGNNQANDVIVILRIGCNCNCALQFKGMYQKKLTENVLKRKFYYIHLLFGKMLKNLVCVFCVCFIVCVFLSKRMKNVLLRRSKIYF